MLIPLSTIALWSAKVSEELEQWLQGGDLQCVLLAGTVPVCAEFLSGSGLIKHLRWVMVYDAWHLFSYTCLILKGHDLVMGFNLAEMSSDRQNWVLKLVTAQEQSWLLWLVVAAGILSIWTSLTCRKSKGGHGVACGMKCRMKSCLESRLQLVWILYRPH